MAEREYQIWNPGNNYYDQVLASMIFGQAYPQGTTRREKVNGEWVDVPIDPLHRGPNTRREATQQASLAEDEMLRGALGSKRSLGKHERMPEGAYTSTKYPGFEQHLFGAESGFVPRGYSWRSLAGESTQDRMERERRQREWAQQQRAMLGMGRF